MGSQTAVSIAPPGETPAIRDWARFVLDSLSRGLMITGLLYSPYGDVKVRETLPLLPAALWQRTT